MMARWIERTLMGLIAATLVAQTPVSITVDAAKTEGPNKPIWAYFGYDEPNYTYTKNGQKLIGELAALSPVPVFIRAHNLLTTGDGTGSLKWGSTNAYTEDADGKPVYDWTVVDRIFDTYLQNKAKPFVELGFMPQALSTHPEPYRHDWPKSFDLGWAYPPKDYAKWAEVVRQLAKHAAARYGAEEAGSWYWEVWNEPDISYWHGTAEEYDKTYDFAVDAVRSVLPTARVGGPATTGPSGAKAAQYLRQFLEHCARGTDSVTGKTGVPLDFITFHAKGSPQLVEGHVVMGISHELSDVDHGMEIVTSFPEFRKLPIVLSEADPEGCAACSAHNHPQNAYRNGPLYACYTAAAMRRIVELADRRGANIAGMLTWAFEFEGQPYFDGFRTLATNGVDKPVLSFFRMAGLMQSQRIELTSTGALMLDDIVRNGVRGQPDVNGFATRSEHTVSAMIWNYHDVDSPGPDSPVKVRFTGLPSSATRFEMLHYRIDASHSNAYTLWKQLGSPQDPSPAQSEQLEAAGQLTLLSSPQWSSPQWVTATGGTFEVEFRLPRQAVSLVQLTW